MPASTDLDTLSRYLSGELEPTERTALEQRLDAEPRLARALAELRTTLADLQELPAERPVPPALLRHTLAELEPAPTAAPRARPALLPWSVAGLAAAAALTLALRTPPPSQIEQGPAGTLVEGSTHLALADGTGLLIDGRARLLPASSHSEHAVSSSLPQLLGGAAAGAALTVLVYEGTARIEPADGSAPTELSAGEQQTVEVAGRAPASPRVERRATTARDPAMPESVEEELARLRQENEQLRFENALVKGNLASHEGAPLEWPPDTPALLREDGFSERVEAAVAQLDGLDLVEVDCSEYPCIGVLRSTDTEPGWQDQAQAVPQALNEDLGEGYGIMAMGRGEDDGTEPVMMMAFALVPADPDSGPDQEAATRIGFRAEEAMTAATDDIRDGSQAP